MPLPRKLVQAAVQSLPLKTLRSCARAEEIRGYQTMDREQLVDRLGVDAYLLAGWIRTLGLPDLRKLALAVGLPKPPVEELDLRKALFKFVLN